jgi:CDP-diacylglycerol--glycerol-3-phosphate 3-phosphatidyltransferase
MFTLSNGLSFIRIPLAFLFLFENAWIRILAIFLAMFTDSIDGYVARKNHSVTRFGVILDPISDKFFVYSALFTLFVEGKLAGWEAAAMLTRDFFLCLFVLFLIKQGKLSTFTVRSILWGKVTTALQFIVLICLILGLSFPWYIYALFVGVGFLAFYELFQAPRSTA